MTMFSVLLPVALMLGKALVDIFIDDKTNGSESLSMCWAHRW